MEQFRNREEFGVAQAAPLGIVDLTATTASSAGPAAPPMDAARLLDLVLATAAIVFLAPLLLTLTILVWGSDGASPFFSQQRIGFGGRRFRCFKFRTMVVDAEARLDAILESNPAAQRLWLSEHKLKTDPRITPAGRFLRLSSLDELPQLFNVVKGDMSLVGPRPIVSAEVYRYGRYFRSYCAVRPGVSGLWQINGRNDVSYRRRVAYDVLYARHRSLWLNLAILLKTAPAVIRRRGCY